MAYTKDSDESSDEGAPPLGGRARIAAFVKNLPDSPGVYRMVGEKEEVLYIGKARSLKRRVGSYLNAGKLPLRLQRMIAATRSMEFAHTHTEAEALLLEANLIKKFKPRYNILLRDDKSFPYIFINETHDFPLVRKHRGAMKEEGAYFGPFASAGHVNKTIAILQRVFMLRNCTDSFFAQRKRPCLQHHIKRCTAPCVGLVSRENYAAQVAEAKAFLEGKSSDLQDRYRAAMEQASTVQDYEGAARYRDRLQSLTAIQAKQDINMRGLPDCDVLALVQKHGRTCVEAFFFRAGQNFGNRSYFPRHDAQEDPADILSAFLAQFYQQKKVPPYIYLNIPVSDHDVLEEALSLNASRKVRIETPRRGDKKRIVDFVCRNAAASADLHAAEKAGEGVLLKGVQDLFGLPSLPERIEVYDNSHIAGTNMVAAMIVAGQSGFVKNAYRKFNIRDAKAGDDYGMMREVLRRRFGKPLTNEAGGEVWPDLVLLDGGLGQLNAAHECLEEMGVAGRVRLAAIAKGPDRHAGREQFFMRGRSIDLPPQDPILHYLQRLRDEAHRFAIGSHRKRRSMEIASNPLDEIEGIGTAKKRALLMHFGSAKAVSKAGIDDLMKAPGISKRIASKIYDYFNQ